MKKRNRIVCAILLCFLLMLNTMTAFAADEESPITGTISAEGTTVTVVLSIAENSGATDGHVMVEYDSNVLTLVSVDGSEFWDVEDINKDYEPNGNHRAVSLAFAKAQPLTEGGAILTVVFTAKETGVEVSADVSVKLYSDLVPISNGVGSDAEVNEFPVSLTIEKETEPSTEEPSTEEPSTEEPSTEAPSTEAPTDEEPQQPEEPEETEAPAAPSTPGDDVATGDQTSIVPLVILMVVAVAAAAGIIVYRKKKA